MAKKMAVEIADGYRLALEVDIAANGKLRLYLWREDMWTVEQRAEHKRQEAQRTLEEYAEIGRRVQREAAVASPIKG